MSEGTSHDGWGQLAAGRHTCVSSARVRARAYEGGAEGCRAGDRRPAFATPCPDVGELGYFPPREYARIMPLGFEAPRVGAPAPTISIVFVTAGNELTPAGAFVDQSTEPFFVESA